jgi:homoserine dehydrogenase
MSAVLEADHVAPAPLGLRTIKIGLLGLGQVNQAVARIAPEASRLKDAGLRFRVAGALVRDIDKPRRCLKPARITTNPSAFLRGNYDVVIEALGTIEPARALVRRLLGRGTPVVTANKALVAAHGPELTALAARRGTALRYEASALAGVPFLGAFAARPLVSDVQQFTAVVNGTSNFILSKLEVQRCTFERALAEARACGLTEPDPTRDLEGLDAADKLALLSSIFAWGALPAFRVETQGITHLTPQDFAVASALDSTIKPVVFASRTGSGISAFVGPALVPRTHPLAALQGALSGIQIKGAFVSDLFFSGPGAGPDITAATLLDDAVEAVSTVTLKRAQATNVVPRVVPLAAAPATEWLIRVTFPGVVPDAAAVTHVFGTHHLQATHVTDAIDNQRWVRTAPTTREALDFALDRLNTTHRFQTFPIRALAGR